VLKIGTNREIRFEGFVGKTFGENAREARSKVHPRALARWKREIDAQEFEPAGASVAEALERKTEPAVFFGVDRNDPMRDVELIRLNGEDGLRGVAPQLP
jgi:hypothetical protein